MICPICGWDNKPGIRFCEECGQKLTADGTSGTKTGMGLKSNSVLPNTQNPSSKTGKTAQSSSYPGSPFALPFSLFNGRYILKKELGAGGMGKIYLAEDTEMDCLVVVKQLLPFYSTPQDKEYMEKRFREEAKLLFRLKHQHLPRVTNFFEENGNLFLVMEFVEGENLEKAVQKKPKNQISLEEGIRWMREILNILQYLHQQNPPIIHRDIKPANIMLTNNGEIFLVDFGVARPVGNTGYTSVGTPGYASMDHYMGDFSPSSDIFSVGATFHFLLSGEPPHDRQPLDFPLLSRYRRDIPHSFQKIISKMLAVNKKDRYQSVEEVLREIEAVNSMNDTPPIPTATAVKISPAYLHSQQTLAFSSPPPMIVEEENEEEIKYKKRRERRGKTKEKRKGSVLWIVTLFLIIASVFLLAGILKPNEEPRKDKHSGKQNYSSPVSTKSSSSSGVVYTPVSEETPVVTPKPKKTFFKTESSHQESSPEETSDTPPPDTPSPEESPNEPLSSVNDEERQIQDLLSTWSSSFHNKDLSSHTACYGEYMDTYFTQHNVDHDFVVKDKEVGFNNMEEISKYDISNVQISFPDADHKDHAVVTLDKTWDTRNRDGTPFSGSEKQELVLKKQGGSWKIVSEKELEIYWVKP